MPKKDDSEKITPTESDMDDSDMEKRAEEIKAEFTEHEIGDVPVDDGHPHTVPTTVEALREEGEEDSLAQSYTVGEDGDLTARDVYKDPEFNPVAAAAPPGHRGGPGAPDDEGSERAEPDEAVKERLDTGHDEQAENLDYDWKGTEPSEGEK